MDRPSKLPTVILVLALIGIVDAGYDSLMIFMNQPLWCPPPIDGCNTVAASPYARVLGIPLGYLGVVFYLGMATIAAALVAAPAWRGARTVALAYATFGFFASIVFFYIQRNYIHAFCIYCLISGVLTFLLFVTTFVHFRNTAVKAMSPFKELARALTPNS